MPSRRPKRPRRASTIAEPDGLALALQDYPEFWEVMIRRQGKRMLRDLMEPDELVRALVALAELSVQWRIPVTKAGFTCEVLALGVWLSQRGLARIPELAEPR